MCRVDSCEKDRGGRDAYSRGNQSLDYEAPHEGARILKGERSYAQPNLDAITALTRACERYIGECEFGRMGDWKGVLLPFLLTPLAERR